MADFLNGIFYKHKQVHKIMNDALSSFEEGDENAKLKYLIRDFEEQEEMASEIDD